MTEQEYIDASNLARVRATRAVFRDFLVMSSADANDARAVVDALFHIETRLAAKVVTKAT
jgi:hypothetical protein